MSPRVLPDLDLAGLAARVERRLSLGSWEERRRADEAPHHGTNQRVETLGEDARAELAAFAIGLAGQRPARKSAGFSRMAVHFALAATVALTGLGSAACDLAPSSAPAIAVDRLATLAGSNATITAASAEPAWFSNLVLLDAGSSAEPWALMVPLDGAAGSSAPPPPVLVDREGAGLEEVGMVYSVAAVPIPVGTRDGTSQFLDPATRATLSEDKFGGDVNRLKTRVQEAWGKDERYAASARTIASKPGVLDLAYNGAAPFAAGGTHTYLDSVILRVDPSNPVIEVADRALVESTQPLRADDAVQVAIRQNERPIYQPGQVVTLRNIVVERSPGEGDSEPIYIANAALEGARVEPTGRIDLERALQQRLARTDADLTAQAQELAAEGIAPTSGPAPQTTVIREYRGPSLIQDYLMWRWLTSPGYYTGPGYTVGGPTTITGRPSGDYYYVSPSTGPRDAPAPAASSQTSTLQAARNAVSGQAAGTGGGTAATLKSAADQTARVSAATAKAASTASQVSTSSVGKSISSVSSSSSSSTAARSAGSTSSSVRASSSSSRGAASGGFGGGGASGGSAS